MTLKYKDNTKKYIKELKKHHGGLSLVSADTVNTAARVLEKSYKKKLRKFILRNKFTMGAVKTFFAKARRSKGGFRNIKDINAIVGVRKMKGGKRHYLDKQETGDTKRGYNQTMKSVAIPLNVARTGESKKKPIKGALRLQRSTINTLKVGGEPLGVPGSKYGTKQSWAIMNKYMKNNKYGWDTTKQFFFTGIRSGLGIFKKIGKRIRKVRDLNKKSVRIKALHKFDKSFDNLTPTRMENIFHRAANRFLKGK
jgi:hypothetical protein